MTNQGASDRYRDYEFLQTRKLDKVGQFSDKPRQIDGTATEMNLQNLVFAGFLGATRQIRTDDLPITNRIY
jgi:hypothetical protein